MTHFLHYLNRFTKTWCAALAGMMLMAVPAAHASFSVDVHPSGSHSGPARIPRDALE